jgi:hypothetical protein
MLDSSPVSCYKIMRDIHSRVESFEKEIGNTCRYTFHVTADRENVFVKNNLSKFMDPLIPTSTSFETFYLQETS